ncbi:MAG: radical SAM protein [Thermodesulfobacteriota bacterium]
MKILFIKPSQGKVPQVIDVPLAFLYLSAYLKRYLKAPVDIELIDLRLTRKIGQALTKRLHAFQPDIIGISLLAMDKAFLNEWSAFLRMNAPDAKIVIGGPSATFEYDDLLLSNDSVDWAVIGEGEVVFLNLVRALIAGKTPNQLDGLAYVDGEKVVCNPRADYIEDLDTLPFPDYGLVNLPDYFGPLGNSFNGFLCKKHYAPVISSRGCPYHCAYCHDVFGKRARKRTPENFVEEIQWLYDEYGIREFHIIDDIFNIDRDRMHAILNLIMASGRPIKLAFPNGLRADLLEREDIALLKRAGAYTLTFAIESASPRVQKIIKKNLDIAKVLENIEYAESIGLIVRGFFMLGFPGETVAEIQSTIALARKTSLDLASFFIVIPFKGTTLSGLVKTMYPGLMYTVRGDYWDENSFYYLATGYDNKKAQVHASLRFYLPFRVFKTLKKFPNKLHMINLVLDFLAVFHKKRVS